MRLRPAAALAMVAASLMLAPADARVRPQQHATTVLAAARLALGGDALLDGITSMTVNGEWAVTFSDYKTEAGLTWPRRFVTTMGGRRHEDMRLGTYKINAPIKPHVFEPKR